MPKAKDFIAFPLFTSKSDRRTANGVYAGRFPTPVYVRDAASPYGPDGKGFTSPYSSTDLNRFEDTFRSDKIAQRALLTKIQLIVSKRPQSVLDSSQEFATEDLRREAVKAVMDNGEYQKLLTEIQMINKRVKFHEMLFAAEVQKRVYGRAVLQIVSQGEDGLPGQLMLHASKNLGNVQIDKDWKLTGVEFADPIDIRTGKRQVIKAEDMLYTTNLDYNVTPNTLYFGLSEYEGVAHDSETNRIISEEDIKEISKGLWAGVGLIKAANITSTAKATQLINAFDPGRWNLVNQDVIVEVHELAHDLDKLVEAREANDRRIIRGIGTPMPLVGYEDVTNRATLVEVLQAYKVSVLDFERTALRNQLEPQWYDTLTMKILGVEDIETIKAKVKMEFQEIVFDTIKDKAEAIAALDRAGVPLPVKAKLRMLDMEDLLEEVEELVEEQKAKEQQMMDDKSNLMEQKSKMMEQEQVRKLDAMREIREKVNKLV